MPLIKSKSKEAFKKNLKTEMKAGKPKNQALAISYRIQREAKGSAAGGGIPYSPVQAPAAKPGLIHSAVPGRTDKLPMKVKSGAYIVPADIVSAVGQGNSMAGARGLGRMFGAPRMPKMPMKPMRKFADGGAVDEPVSEPVEIVAAGGEYVIDPEQVAEIGGGDIAQGHDILDAFVKQVRSKTIKTLKSLPSPKKN